MKWRWLGIVAVVAAAFVGIAIAVQSSPRSPYGEETHGPRPAPDCTTLSPPCPEIKQSNFLDKEWLESAVSFRFEPPPQDATPAVSDRDAVNIAWQEGGSDGSSEHAILVLIPKGGDFPEDTLAWVIRYENHCFVPHGNPAIPTHPGCSYQPSFTMIDASTGAFIVSWTRPAD